LNDNARKDPDSYSIGNYLKRQRELRGIPLKDIAKVTHLPLRSLEKLETGAFDHDRSGFARGFVRTYAEAVGLDPDEAVTRMLVELKVPKESPLGRSRVRLLMFLGAFFVVVSTVFLLSRFSQTFFKGSSDLDVSVWRADPIRELADRLQRPMSPELKETENSSTTDSDRQ
tara:strand:+ start:707 stop:1219 length:513 start_codon:yes stop_codon:yes gene_type:complete